MKYNFLVVTYEFNDEFKQWEICNSWYTGESYKSLSDELFSLTKNNNIFILNVIKLDIYRGDN